MQESATKRIRSVSDWFGIIASTTCGIHCIVVPTLLVTGTVLPASFLADETFHLALLWVIVPAAVLAFGIGCRKHKDMQVLALGIIGVSGMILAVTLPHEIIGETGERAITLVSAAILVLAHYRNFRLCQSADCAHE